MVTINVPVTDFTFTSYRTVGGIAVAPIEPSVSEFTFTGYNATISRTFRASPSVKDFTFTGYNAALATSVGIGVIPEGVEFKSGGFNGDSNLHPYVAQSLAWLGDNMVWESQNFFRPPARAAWTDRPPHLPTGHPWDKFTFEKCWVVMRDGRFFKVLVRYEAGKPWIDFTFIVGYGNTSVRNKVRYNKTPPGNVTVDGTTFFDWNGKMPGVFSTDILVGTCIMDRKRMVFSAPRTVNFASTNEYKNPVYRENLPPFFEQAPPPPHLDTPPGGPYPAAQRKAVMDAQATFMSAESGRDLMYMNSWVTAKQSQTGDNESFGLQQLQLDNYADLGVPSENIDVDAHEKHLFDLMKKWFNRPSNHYQPDGKPWTVRDPRWNGLVNWPNNGWNNGCTGYQRGQQWFGDYPSSYLYRDPSGAQIHGEDTAHMTWQSLTSAYYRYRDPGLWQCMLSKIEYLYSINNSANPNEIAMWQGMRQTRGEARNLTHLAWFYWTMPHEKQECRRQAEHYITKVLKDHYNRYNNSSYGLPPRGSRSNTIFSVWMNALLLYGLACARTMDLSKPADDDAHLIANAIAKWCIKAMDKQNGSWRMPWYANIDATYYTGGGSNWSSRNRFIVIMALRYVDWFSRDDTYFTGSSPGGGYATWITKLDDILTSARSLSERVTRPNEWGTGSPNHGQTRGSWDQRWEWQAKKGNPGGGGPPEVDPQQFFANRDITPTSFDLTGTHTFGDLSVKNLGKPKTKDIRYCVAEEHDVVYNTIVTADVVYDVGSSNNVSYTPVFTEEIFEE